MIPDLPYSLSVSNSEMARIPAIIASSSTAPGLSDTKQNKIEMSLSVGVTSSGLCVQAHESDYWNAEKNGRFNLLARKESLGSLSIEEHLELEKLTRLRRVENFPRSADEILWQRKQQRLTADIVLALKKYVDFHEASRSS